MQYELNPNRVKINGEIRYLLPDHEQAGKYSHIPENEQTEEQKWMNLGYRIGPIVED